MVGQHATMLARTFLVKPKGLCYDFHNPMDEVDFGHFTYYSTGSSSSIAKPGCPVENHQLMEYMREADHSIRIDLEKIYDERPTGFPYQGRV